jgi:His-Xaa-Ser system radical SAM maturase HxsB
MNKYYLMPFSFYRLPNLKELIINVVGDYLLVPNGSINDIIGRNISMETNTELYLDLLSNFIISETPLNPLIDILATKYRTKKESLSNFTGLHIFAITLRCDHKCDYCQVSRQSQDFKEFDMSFDVIDKSIDLMFKSPSDYLTMEFQGGEPLLVFDKIKYAIEKTKLKNNTERRRIKFVICTNLTHLNNEILEYCKVNDIFLSCSLDGPEFLHNCSRIYLNNSYKSTIAGVQLAQDFLGKDKVSALMTTTTMSLDFPVEIIDEYRKNGFKNIFLRPINPYGYALRTQKNSYNTQQFTNFYKRALDYIISLNFKGEFFVEEYARIILTKILTPFNINYVDLQSPSGIITGVVVYNRDGNVYASDESRMLGEMGDYVFLLGNVINDNYDKIFYGEKSSSLSKYMCNESLAGCSNCAFQIYCGADPVHNYATQGEFYGKRYSNAFCSRNKEIFSYLFELIDKNPDVFKVFKSWVLN